MAFTESFKNYLENIPQGILEEEKKSAEKFGNGDTEKIIAFAKAAYPKIYAYKRIFNTCCRPKEELGIHKLIKDEKVRKRFDKFLREGGDIEKIRAGKVDEAYLFPGDLEIFRNAEAEAHKEVHKETREEIAGRRKDEFIEFKKEGEEKLKQVEEKIGLLRKMAEENPEWRAEILEKAGDLEERWANYGNEPQEIDAQELLEYYASIAGGE